jgi:hypothetical protein
MSNITPTGRANTLDTSGDKYGRVLDAIENRIFKKETFLSLNNNNPVTEKNQSLKSTNELLDSSIFMKKLPRNDKRGNGAFGCFGKKKWQAGVEYNMFDGDGDPSNQNCIAFDNELKVTFLCLSNNKNNLKNKPVVSNIRPGSQFSNLKNLREHGANPIQTSDGYTWIALLPEAHPLIEDSSWSTMIIREIDFPQNSTGKFVDDSLSDFKSAVSTPDTATTLGTVGFYAKQATFDPTDGTTVSAGSLLLSASRVKRYDVYQLWKGLTKGLGIETETRFISGESTTETNLPSSITLTSLHDEIESAIDVNSPLGWYNHMVNLWKKKTGSVLSVTLDTSGLSDDFLRVTQIPTISAVGNKGTNPTCEFIYRQINEQQYEIQGVKISTDIATGNLDVGSGNSNVKFTVNSGDTGKNSTLENRLSAILTPTDESLLDETVLYNRLINIAGYMIAYKVPSSEINTTLSVANSVTPLKFDSYSILENLTDDTNNFKLGSNTSENENQNISNLFDALVRRSGGGNTPISGMSVWKADKGTASSIIKTPPIGYIQSAKIKTGVNPDFFITFTSKTGKIGTDFTFPSGQIYIGDSSGASLYTFQSATKKSTGAPSGSSANVLHVGTSNVDFSGINNSVFGVKFIQLV